MQLRQESGAERHLWLGSGLFFVAKEADSAYIYTLVLRLSGANWIRPGSSKRKLRAVVGQQATLKADQT